MYDALFRRLGAAEVVGRPAREPRARPHDPELVGAARRRHRHLHDRRQPAQALRDRQRHRRSATRSSRPTSRGAVVGGTSAGASIQSSHMVAFGVGGLDAQAADDPGRGRARPARATRDRPALRPAQPLRPAADDRRPVARSCSASASTRTPRAVITEDGRRTRCCASSAAARSRPRRPRHGLQRPRGQALRAAARLAAWCCTCCRPGARVRPDRRARWCPTTPHGRPRARPRSSPRPAATCASWPATSPPATPRPTVLRRRPARAPRPTSSRARQETDA